MPALRDAAEVFAGIERRPGTIYVAAGPEPEGRRAGAGGRVDEINLVMSVSETHNRANMGMTPGQSLASLRRDRGAGCMQVAP